MSAPEKIAIFVPILKKIIMKKVFIVMCLTLMPFWVTAQDVLGKWKLEDGSAIVEVYSLGDVFNGKIIWLKQPTMKDGSPVVDVFNPNTKLRSRKIMGLNILSGLKKDGKEYSGGLIYDPNNGNTYYCSMKVEGDTLKVRGSLDKRGFLGRTMDWFRVK